MDLKDIARRILAALKAEGADKAECTVTYADKDESNLLGHAEYLLREFESADADFNAYWDGRPAKMRINQFDDASIAAYAKRARMMAEAAPKVENTTLGFRGYMRPDCEPAVERDPVKLYTRFEEMIADMTREFPDVDMDGDALYSLERTYYTNTDGKELTNNTTDLHFGWQAAASDRRDSTSDIGFCSGEVTTWDTPFIDLAEDMRKNAAKLMTMLGAKPIGRGKFVGTLVIPPEYLGIYTGQIVGRIASMKEGDGLPSPECGEQLTVYESKSDVPYGPGSKPDNSPNAEVEYYIKNGKPVPPATAGMTDEQMLAYENEQREKGKTLPYSLFGTMAGDTPYAELIKGVKQGLLIGFVQGSMPAENGDFSGAAKGSFYIENGEIKHPVVECMVSGNVFELFRNIRAISSETEFSRGCMAPYVAVDGATIV